MKTFKTISKFFAVTVLTLSLGMLNINIPKQNNGFDSAAINFETFLNQASADILTGDAPITGEQVTLIRFMYLLINGPTSSGYPTGFDGPPTGLLGMIRQITGPTALGGGVTAAGYGSCSAIPATGKYTMTEDDGSQFKMYFETPGKTIPTGYTGAGGTYAKRVVVQYRSSRSGTFATFFNIEFQCGTNVGWLRFFENGQDATTARHIEVYWDTETATASKMELYMYYEGGLASANGNEYFVAKFETGASNTFKYWVTRAVDKTDTANDQGMRTAANGNSSTKLVNAFLLFTSNVTNSTSDHNDNGSILTGDVQCLDLTTATSPVAGSGCTALDATGGAPLIDSSAGFTIAWIADTTNGMKNDMTTVAEPTNP